MVTNGLEHLEQPGESLSCQRPPLSLMFYHSRYQQEGLQAGPNDGIPKFTPKQGILTCDPKSYVTFAIDSYLTLELVL